MGRKTVAHRRSGGRTHRTACGAKGIRPGAGVSVSVRSSYGGLLYAGNSRFGRYCTPRLKCRAGLAQSKMKYMGLPTLTVHASVRPGAPYG
jgi:hypothetical protein